MHFLAIISNNFLSNYSEITLSHTKNHVRHMFASGSRQGSARGVIFGVRTPGARFWVTRRLDFGVQVTLRWASWTVVVGLSATLEASRCEIFIKILKKLQKIIKKYENFVFGLKSMTIHQKRGLKMGCSNRWSDGRVRGARFLDLKMRSKTHVKKKIT